MKRNISSDSSLGHKFSLPIFMIVGFGLLILIDTLEGCQRIIYLTKDIQGWTFIICIFVCWHHTYRCACLKRVSMDESFLYISDYRGREIRIPFPDVVLVRQTYPMRVPREPELVMIILSSPSEFGKKIFFIPKNEYHSMLDPHPIVGELNRLVSSHKQKKKHEDTGE